MSGPRLSIIPARAATDPALKPRDLQVLCVLGRHTDDLGWCRKSQVKMAEEMGCARSTVFDAVERLVVAGYLERYVQESDNGRDSPHVYRVILDPKHPAPEAVRETESAPEDPCRQVGTPADISAPPAGPGPAPPAGPGPAPKNDSLRTTYSERERERGRETDDRKAAERWLKDTHRRWPTYLTDSEPKAIAAAIGLTADERSAAAARMADYLAGAKVGGRQTICTFAVYLAEKRWEKLPERQPAPAASSDLPAPAFGPLWGALRARGLLAPMADIAEKPATREATAATFATMAGHIGRERVEAHFRRGGFDFDADGALIFPDDFEARAWRDLTARRGWPAVNRMDAGARAGHGIRVAAGLGWLGGLTEAVPVGSPVFEAWRDEHERRGWPFVPDPGGQRVVYFPIGGPEGLVAFDAALRGNQDDAHGRATAE